MAGNFGSHAGLGATDQTSVDQTGEAEGRGEQRRGLRTKPLMRDLGTRLNCQQKVFRTGKTLWK